MARKAKAPSKPAPKLHGNNRPIMLLLPPALVDRIDAVAQHDRRSRASMIRLMLERMVGLYELHAEQRKAGTSTMAADLAELLERMASG